LFSKKVQNTTYQKGECPRRRGNTEWAAVVNIVDTIPLEPHVGDRVRVEFQMMETSSQINCKTIVPKLSPVRYARQCLVLESGNDQMIIDIPSIEYQPILGLTPLRNHTQR
jgi:hypothetical protein